MKDNIFYPLCTLIIGFSAAMWFCEQTIDVKCKKACKTDSLNQVIEVKTMQYDDLCEKYIKMQARAIKAEEYKERHMINDAKMKIKLSKN